MKRITANSQSYLKNNIHCEKRSVAVLFFSMNQAAQISLYWIFHLGFYDQGYLVQVLIQPDTEG